MSGDQELDDLLGPEPVTDEPENLVDAAPPRSRPMGEASRALLERSRSYPMPRSPRKNTPDRLIRIINYAKQMPVVADVCRRAEISNTTLKWWLQKSFEGAAGDGFDIPLGTNDELETDTLRFHVAFDDAMAAGVEAIEAVGHIRATGYEEPQVYKGRVQYKMDPVIVQTYIELGLPVDDRDQNIWLRDAAGAPVPETVTKIDPDLLMFILKARKPQVYGQKASVDLNVKGGVLVVGMRAATSEALNELENKYRKEGRPAVTFEEGDDKDPM